MRTVISDTRIYETSKRLEEALADPVRRLVEEVYGCRVLGFEISPADQAVRYDYRFYLEDGTSVEVDLKSAYKARKAIPSATAKSLIARAQHGVDQVVLTRWRLYYLNANTTMRMLSHYPADEPLDLEVLDEYADTVCDVQTLPNYQQVDKLAEELHELRQQRSWAS